MDSHQHYIDHCNRALEAVRPLIPVDLAGEVDDYINRFREWGLGIEILIDQLREYEIKISRDQFILIQAAMNSMDQGESSRIVYLRKNGVSPGT